MKPILFALLTLIVLASSLGTAGEEKAPVLVTPQWLSEHLKDPNLVVLSVCQNRRAYTSGHVPGARFLWVTWMAASTPELSFQLVPIKQLDTLMEGLGINNKSRIVLTSVNGNVSTTARVYVTLEYLGLGDQTSILDGGFDKWKKEGNPVSTETPAVKRTKFTPHVHNDAIVDAEYVTSHMNSMTVVDARAPEFYSGKSSNGFPRAGHVPGALNLYYTTLFDSTDRYLPVDSLSAKFGAAGVKDGDEIITYCHVGQTACSDYVAAKILGHKVHLYDGSFDDWSSREDLPIVNPSKQDTTKH